MWLQEFKNLPFQPICTTTSILGKSLANSVTLIGVGEV